MATIPTRVDSALRESGNSSLEASSHAGGLPTASGRGGLPTALDRGGLPTALDRGGLPTALGRGGLPTALGRGGLPTAAGRSPRSARRFASRREDFRNEVEIRWPVDVDSRFRERERHGADLATDRTGCAFEGFFEAE